MKYKILYGGKNKKISSKLNFIYFDVLVNKNSTMPFIPLNYSGMKKSLNKLLNPNDIVIKTKTPPKLEIDYPLNNPYIKQLDKCVWTRLEIAKMVAETYQKIYKEELEGTEKKYGIYGHSIEDLVLTTVIYNSKKNIITLTVDS